MNDIIPHPQHFSSHKLMQKQIIDSDIEEQSISLQLEQEKQIEQQFIENEIIQPMLLEKPIKKPPKKIIMHPQIYKHCDTRNTQVATYTTNDGASNPSKKSVNIQMSLNMNNAERQAHPIQYVCVPQYIPQYPMQPLQIPIDVNKYIHHPQHALSQAPEQLLIPSSQYAPQSIITGYPFYMPMAAPMVGMNNMCDIHSPINCDGKKLSTQRSSPQLIGKKDLLSNEVDIDTFIKESKAFIKNPELNNNSSYSSIKPRNFDRVLNCSNSNIATKEIETNRLNEKANQVNGKENHILHARKDNCIKATQQAQKKVEKCKSTTISCIEANQKQSIHEGKLSNYQKIKRESIEKREERKDVSFMNPNVMLTIHHTPNKSENLQSKGNSSKKPTQPPLRSNTTEINQSQIQNGKIKSPNTKGDKRTNIMNNSSINEYNVVQNNQSNKQVQHPNGDQNVVNKPTEIIKPVCIPSNSIDATDQRESKPVILSYNMCNGNVLAAPPQIKFQAHAVPKKQQRKEKSKEELAEYRKRIMKGHHKSEYIICSSDHKSKPKQNNLMERLAQGKKVKVNRKEMLKLTQKNYMLLPEIREKLKKKEEELQKKEEAKYRKQAIIELDKVIFIIRKGKSCLTIANVVCVRYNQPTIHLIVFMPVLDALC